MSTENVLVVADGTAKYELTGTQLIVSVPAPGSEKHVLRFLLSTYTAPEVARFYGDYTKTMRRWGSEEVLHISPNPKPVLDFISAHLLELKGIALADGSVPSREVAAEWLDSKPALKEAVFSQAFDDFQFSEPSDPEEEDRDALLIIPISETISAVTEQKLFWEEGGKDMIIAIRHTFGKFTETERVNYTRSFRSIEHTKRHEVRIESDFKTMENLYDARIKSLANALYQGQECVESNKDLWAPRVPLLMKVVALAKAMRGVERKN